MKGLILCGGKGTRLRPYSHSRPKHLLPVANQPVIQYAIEKMKQVGIREIGIVVPPYYRSIFAETLGNRQPGVGLQYIEQPAAKGLADAVRYARSFVGDSPFMLFLGDNFYAGELEGFVKRFKREQPDALLMVHQVQNPSQFGVVQFEGNRVSKLFEKPKNPPSSYAIVGIYLFTPAIFAAIDQLQPSARGEYEITDAIQGLIDEGLHVAATTTDGWWKDTGQPKDLLACNRHVLLELRGEHYGANVKIEASTIEGPVMIEPGAQIKHSVLRGPIVIGRDTRIQDSYVGPFSSIGHHAWLERIEIENSIVLEHARLSKITKRIDESIIGVEVTIEGSQNHPRSIRVQLGDHSKVYLPMDED